MKKYYYFAFANADPMRTAFSAEEISIEEMRSRFVGTWVNCGDEDYDAERVVDVWTQDRAREYFND